MTSSKCAHRIQIANLSNGESVNHSLLLIKGNISRGAVGSGATQSCTGGRTATGKQDNIENHVQLRLLSPVNQSEELQQFNCKAPVSRSGEFKLLADLRRHCEATSTELTLCLRYCNAEECRLRIVCRTPQAHPTAGDVDYRRLQPLLILCCDEVKAEEAFADALEKIDLNLGLVQCVYADKLRAAGFGRRTFTLNGPCQLFYTQLSCAEAWQRSEDELWTYFASELLNSPTWGQQNGANQNLKFVAFIACTKYDAAAVAASGDFSYANIRRHLQAHAALGGGGLALFGSAYFYAWPQHFEEILNCFGDCRGVDPAQLPDDSNYRRTYGGVYATTLGAVCHELGHTFDLGHTRDGVMGADFDYVNRVFTVDTRTENLPTRIIHKGLLDAPASSQQQRSRLTQLKRPNSAITFLDKYHEQRHSDSFYFTRNCALILAHHKWLSDGSQSDQDAAELESYISFDCSSNSVISAAHALKIVELRCHANSLVEHFYEFDADVFCFQLPAEALNCCITQQSHYIFVMTAGGHTKRLLGGD